MSTFYKMLLLKIDTSLGNKARNDTLLLGYQTPRSVSPGTATSQFTQIAFLRAVTKTWYIREHRPYSLIRTIVLRIKTVFTHKLFIL